MSQIKLIAGALLVLGITLGVWHIIGAFDERDRLRADVALSKDIIKSRDEAISELNRNAVADAAIRDGYLTKLNGLQNETEKLKKCIDDKSCGITIRVRTVTIQAPSDRTSFPADTSGVVEGAAELAPDAKRAYFRHRDAIDIVKSNFDLCLSTLKEWQNDKRCR